MNFKRAISSVNSFSDRPDTSHLHIARQGMKPSSQKVIGNVIARLPCLIGREDWEPTLHHAVPFNQSLKILTKLLFTGGTCLGIVGYQSSVGARTAFG